jgi:hypothetical protein
MALSSNSQTLRAVGQALENEHLEDFDLENHDGDFLVRGRPALPERGEMLIREILRRLGERGGLTELHYGPADVHRLEEEGRAKRRNDSGMPDFNMLSQLLRTVGGYVDQKGGRLFSVSRHGSRITLQYQVGEGDLTIEAHEVPSFYKFFSEMYLQRGIDSSPRSESSRGTVNEVVAERAKK